MKTALRVSAMILILLLSVRTTVSAEPLPGTCGLADPMTSTLAFMGSVPNQDTDQGDFSMAACQAMDFSTLQIYGCSSNHFATGGNHGALRLSLSEAGFHSPYSGNTTLGDVVGYSLASGDDELVVRTYDPYLVQAVTAYLNSLYVNNYPYNSQEVLDGYHNGTISEASFAWHNDGAFGGGIEPYCPLQ